MGTFQEKLKIVDHLYVVLKEYRYLKKKYSFLRVFDNSGNYGFDISVLNILKNNQGDFILILCSDLEDPPKLGFEMLSELINN